MTNTNNSLNIKYSNLNIYFKKIKGNIEINNKGNNIFEFILKRNNNSSKIEESGIKNNIDMNLDPFDILLQKLDKKIEEKENKINKEQLIFDIKKLDKIKDKNYIKEYIINKYNIDNHTCKIKDKISIKKDDNLLVNFKMYINDKIKEEYFIIKDNLLINLEIDYIKFKKYEDILIKFLLSANFKEYENNQYIIYNYEIEKIDLNDNKNTANNELITKTYIKQFNKIDSIIDNYNNIKNKDDLYYIFNYLILINNSKEINNIISNIKNRLYKNKIIDTFGEISINRKTKKEKLLERIDECYIKYKYIAIKGMEYININDKKDIIRYLINNIGIYNLKGFIISDSSGLDDVYSEYEDYFLKFKLPNYNIDEIYNMLINKLKHHNIKYQFVKKDVISNLKRLYKESNNKNEIFVNNMYSLLLKNKIENNLSIITKECFPKLKSSELININNLVGLKDIKKDINKLKIYLNYNKNVLNNKNDIYLNSIFTGNPGTGKTTIARIITHNLYELGFIKKDKIIEVTPNDLIGQYLGQTTIVVKEILNKAKDCVLFIDEAYLFLNRNEFFKEALVELLKYMENPHNIVFFAGYSKKMQEFIKCNSGLESRIGYYYNLPNFSLKELIIILKNKLKLMNLSIDNKAIEKIKEVINIYKDNENFGNGRFIDKLINYIIVEHAVNSKKTKDNNNIINEKDINIDDICMNISLKENKFGI